MALFCYGFVDFKNLHQDGDGLSLAIWVWIGKPGIYLGREREEAWGQTLAEDAGFYLSPSRLDFQ